MAVARLAPLAPLTPQPQRRPYPLSRIGTRWCISSPPPPPPSCAPQAQYAVRGEVVLRAMSHAKALARGESRPFSKLVYCNIGNPQELGQAPVTFFRQVSE
jgi:hypothetical protein